MLRLVTILKLKTLCAYVDVSGTTVKFKYPYVGWTSVRQRGDKSPPTMDIIRFPEQST